MLGKVNACPTQWTHICHLAYQEGGAGSPNLAPQHKIEEPRSSGLLDRDAIRTGGNEEEEEPEGQG